MKIMIPNTSSFLYCLDYTAISNLFINTLWLMLNGKEAQDFTLLS